VAQRGSLRVSLALGRVQTKSTGCSESPSQLLVENAVKVEPVGEFELKGIRRPLAAYNVLAAMS
jgi:hypothetical protein